MNHLRELWQCVQDDRLIVPGRSPGSPHKASRWSEMIHFLADEAMCFSLGQLLPDELKAVKPSEGGFRLPFRVTWLEFSPFADNATTLGLLALQSNPGPVVGAVFMRDLGSWQAVSFIRNLDLSACSWDWYGNQETMQAEALVTAAALAACQLVRCLACSNVTRIEHKPDAALQKARERRGRAPLFSYWTLHVNTGKVVGAQLGGTHASPRVHLVRGYARSRLGKWHWVQPHARGDRGAGMVHKDYSVRPRNPHQPSAGA